MNNDERDYDLTPEEIEVEFIYDEVSDEIERLKQEMESLPHGKGLELKFGTARTVHPLGQKEEMKVKLAGKISDLGKERAEKVAKILEHVDEKTRFRAYARIDARENPGIGRVDKKDLSLSQQQSMGDIYKERNAKDKEATEKINSPDKEPVAFKEPDVAPWSYSFSLTPSYDAMMVEEKSDIEPDEPDMDKD